MQWMWSYPAWLLVLVALVAAAITWLLYKGRGGFREIHPLLTCVMAACRFAALFLVGLLLLNPLLRYQSTIEYPPVVIVLEDNSASLRQGWSKEEKDLYLKERLPAMGAIQRQFKVHFYTFGNQLKPSSAGDSLTFSDNTTDISSAIENALQNHAGSNVAAIVLSSDGLFNTGSSPLYARTQGIPIYTIALGDTTIRKDLLIRQLRYNDLVYLGDEFSLLVDMAAYKLEGASTTLTIRNETGTVLKSQVFNIYSNDWTASTDVLLKADKPGINRFTVQVTQVNGEVTLQNNIATAYINVIDGRQKALLLYDAPHPDVRFIRDVLEANQNFEIKVSRWADWSGSLGMYDMLILHGLPSIKDRSRTQELMRQAREARSLWLITTTNSDLPALNELQDLVKLEVTNKSPNEVLPRYQANFSRFSVSLSAIQWLEQTPPLVTPYGNHALGTTAEVIWYQNIGKVATNQPLLMVGGTDRKRAVLLGEGLWRWAMQEHLRTEQNTNTTEWVDRLIQYVAVKSDQRPFRIRSAKDVYDEGEPVSLDAALFNESYQLVNAPDVSLKVRSDDGEVSEYVMDKTGNAYSIRLGALKPGSYTASAKVNFNGKAMETSTRFSVRELMLETMLTTADHSMLRSLSLSSGGKMLNYREMSLLPQMLQDDDRIKPLLSEQFNTKSLLDLKWFFFLILAFLTLEWFLRRFFGSY